MASRPADILSEPKSLKVLMEKGYGNLISKINQLKEEIEADRVVKIKEKLDKNQKKLQRHLTHVVNPLVNNVSSEVSALGNKIALSVPNGSLPSSVDKDFANDHEVTHVKTTKLPITQRIPPYTSWIFLYRNQRMAEDQSVVGRRRIYYDQSGNEALICSDSEDDTPEVKDDKREFSQGEDRILWMAFQEHGLDDNVAEVVTHFTGGSPAEVQKRYHELKQKFEVPHEQGSSESNLSLKKNLSGVLDSFDNLFCRRCLVFNCRLHGCFQNLVYPIFYPINNQSTSSEPVDRKPCGDQCYLLVKQTTKEVVQGSENHSSYRMDNMDHNIVQDENRGSNVLNIAKNVSSADVRIGCNLKSAAGEGSIAGVLLESNVGPIAQHINVPKRKINDDNDRETRKNPQKGQTTSITKDVRSQTREIVEGEVHDINRRLQLKQPTVSLNGQSKTLAGSCEWKPLEKDLCMKGADIFGQNSCLIARNLLSGLKTCKEVSDYMKLGVTSSRGLRTRVLDIKCSTEYCATSDIDNTEQGVPRRSRPKSFRKRGRSRRLKYSTKYNGHPSSWKSVGDEDRSCKQYIPCTCEPMCGKDCSCLKRGTCCEKYCKCSKLCKNTPKGCQCAKSQCRSRQCPCFAANRECDPDVCRHCWVSCGGGELGEPPKKGDGHCGNMRILLKQRQRILLGRSDIVGWGAFIKNPVNKHDYLGEYTGELISQREADKRGKIYDRANSSYLFDLNDQYVLDACRTGDKLKFANHSSKPNCYCKVMLVAGDHRVGIFSKDHLEAGEELFYDYGYGPDQAPEWARKPGAPKKKDDYVPSQVRARKHQSH